MNRREKGFTIIELMVALAILGILATLAVPAMKNFMVQRRLSGAAREVMSDLMGARMRAVNLNRTVKVSFYSNHQYKIDSTGTPQDKDIQADYYDVTLSATGDPQFYAGGTSFGATITVTNSGGSKSVKVASTGRVLIN